jgi:hypothetical protein
MPASETLGSFTTFPRKKRWTRDRSAIISLNETMVKARLDHR